MSLNIIVEKQIFIVIFLDQKCKNNLIGLYSVQFDLLNSE